MVDGHGHGRVGFLFSFSLDIYWLVWDFSHGSVRNTYGLGYVGGDEDGAIKLTFGGVVGLFGGYDR